MIINLLRAAAGYVEFEVGGGFAERFINLCTVDGIALWNVENDGVKVKAFTSEDGFLRINRAVKNSGMTLLSHRKRGLPQFVKRHKARCGVCIGAFLCFSFVWFMSSFIWSVEIVGNSSVKSYDLTNSAAVLGVKPGSLKRNIVPEEVALKLLAEYDRLSWAAVNIFGSKAVIEVREAVIPDIKEDFSMPSNVKAEKTGQIVSIEGYSGTNAVKENEAVAAGDLLISGIITNADGTEKLTHASGKVLAKTVNTYSETVACDFSSALVGKAKLRTYLYVFGFQIPLSGKCEGGIFGSGTERLKGGSELLPLGLSWKLFLQTKTAEIHLNESAAKLYALSLCAEKMREMLADADIKRCVFFTDEKDEKSDEVTIGFKADCIEDIAAVFPIETE